MYLPRPKFTVRWLMVAVAIVGLAAGGKVWLDRRVASFRDRVAKAKREFARSEVFTMARNEWILTILEKYERAARYPWLSVPPDPPEPK